LGSGDLDVQLGRQWLTFADILQALILVHRLFPSSKSKYLPEDGNPSKSP
jgi:hypothetical protein